MPGALPFDILSPPSSQSRVGFERIPQNLTRTELLRYFTFSVEDRHEILECRGDHNRIGFALLLGGVRLTGRFPYDLASIPRHLLSHLCGQLGLETPLFVAYPQRQPTRYEHVERLKAYLGLRAFKREDHPLIDQFVRQQVRAGARVHELLPSTEQMLRTQGILLPGVTVLERLVGAARIAAEEELYGELGRRTDRATKERILALLQTPPGQRMAPFQQLQRASGCPSPEAFAQEVELLTQVRTLLPENLDLSDLAPSLLERLAETLLNEQLRLLDQACPANPSLEMRDDRFHLMRAERFPVPPSAYELRLTVRRMLQRRHLSDLLLETQGWTGFLKAFTRVTSGRPITEADASEQITLLACLIAEGCNIGLSDMAVASAGLSFDQLEEIYATYVREETLAQATAVLVNFQLQQPLAEAWGQGTTSSSDARVYGVPVRALNATFHPKYFASAGRGIGVYTHV